MEQIANLHIEKLPEGVYLATCKDIPGLLAQGRTITETLEIARDVAKKLLEAQTERHHHTQRASTQDPFDYPLILGTCCLSGIRSISVSPKICQDHYGVLL